MKRFILAMVLSCVCLVMSALTHTVNRGESLNSIAEQYNITVAQLLEANPGADNLFFVGMKLNIPEAAQVVQQTPPVHPDGESTQALNQASAQAPAQAEGNNNAEDEYYSKPGWVPDCFIAYGFLSDGDGEYNNGHYGGRIAVGADYFFMKKSGVYAGLQIGYLGTHIGIKQKSGYHLDTMDWDFHFITVPVKVGYLFTDSKHNFGFTPYVGLGFNFCVAAKRKESIGGESDSEKLKKEFGFELNLGAKISFRGFYLHGSYNLPLNDGMKAALGSDDGYPEVGLGWWF